MPVLLHWPHNTQPSRLSKDWALERLTRLHGRRVSAPPDLPASDSDRLLCPGSGPSWVLLCAFRSRTVPSLATKLPNALMAGPPLYGACWSCELGTLRATLSVPVRHESSAYLEVLKVLGLACRHTFIGAVNRPLVGYGMTADRWPR